MEGHQQPYYGMVDLEVAPEELAAVAEELAKTSSKVLSLLIRRAVSTFFARCCSSCSSLCRRCLARQSLDREMGRFPNPIHTAYGCIPHTCTYRLECHVYLGLGRNRQR